VKSEDRRKKILEYLDSQSEPVSGTSLAGIFNVTRQVIVRDMAILRAERNNIIATSQGYMTLPGRKLFSKRVVCSHIDEGDMKAELMTFVECGCKVMDVIVEHPIYGEIRGNLMLSSSKEVDAFLEKVSSSKAALLSRLTNGIHIHTVEAINEDAIEKAKDVLREKGILVE
jgi:transcriptional regulator of NAD metabolism